MHMRASSEGSLLCCYARGSATSAWRLSWANFLDIAAWVMLLNGGAARSYVMIITPNGKINTTLCVV
jgi:hypothetical protein